MSLSPFQHLFHTQAGELRHVDELDVFALEAPSLAADDVLQVEDGHVVVAVQVDAALAGEEAKALLFAAEPLAELSAGDALGGCLLLHLYSFNFWFYI